MPFFFTVGPVTEVLNGTCVPLHAQFDENCGESCPCDLSQGKECDYYGNHTCLKYILSEMDMMTFSLQED
jgi:hypothetical protein